MLVNGIGYLVDELTKTVAGRRGAKNPKVNDVERFMPF
jgi:hypothetical protein